MKRALISGITGQDGSYLAELLLSQGYEVHGLVRRVAGAQERAWRLEGVEPLLLHQGHVEDLSCVTALIESVRPDEIYHLAAQSFVGTSWDDPFGTLHTNIHGTANMLWAFQHRAPRGRFYFAGSSEQFGQVRETPQTECTPFYPRSPYGVSKTTGFELTRNFRESYGLFACSGLLYNHESPRRGAEFVTQKIARGAARVRRELDAGRAPEPVRLGNLEAQRDWGHARDYVRAMWLMLQQPEPRDYVVGTGQAWSVRDFCKLAFGEVGLDYHEHVVSDPAFVRPAEVQVLLGDARRARDQLGWVPEVSFSELVAEMVQAGLSSAHPS